MIGKSLSQQRTLAEPNSLNFWSFLFKFEYYLQKFMSEAGPTSLDSEKESHTRERGQLDNTF